MSRPTDLVIPLFGLRCGSCALRARRKLESLSGVANASVSVPRERAVVSYSRQHTVPSEIMSVIEEAGFDPRIVRARLALLDSRFALTSPGALRDALCSEKGVVAAAADMITEEVLVDYLPEETGPDRIARAVSKAGFGMAPATAATRATGPWLARAIISLLFALTGTILSFRIGAIDWPQSFAGQIGRWLAASFSPVNSLDPSSIDVLTVILGVLTLAVGARTIFVDAWRALVRRRFDANAAAALSMLALILLSIARLVTRGSSAGLATAAMWELAILHSGKFLEGRLKRRSRAAEPEPVECGHPLSNIELRAEKLASRATSLALIAAITALGAWIALAGTSHLLTGILAFAAVLVAVSAPSIHLGVAAALEGAMAKAAGHGIRFLSGRSVEKVGAISDIVVLETALSTRTFASDYVLVQGTTVAELLRYAMSVGPVSDIAGIEAVFARGATLTAHEARRVERSGPGLAVAILDRENVTVGKAAAIRAANIDTTSVDDEIAAYSSLGRSPIVVAVRGQVIGAIIVSREISDETRQTLRRLRAAGHPVWLATREEPETGRALARILDIDGVMSQPDRAKWWQELRGVGRRDGRAALIGDGSHDEDLLVKADRAISLGRSESGADARIVSGGIGGVLTALQIAETAMRRSRTNLRSSLIYNLVAIVTAAGALVPLTGLLPSPPLSIAFMVAATLLIEWNGARLRR